MAEVARVPSENLSRKVECNPRGICNVCARDKTIGALFCARLHCRRWLNTACEWQEGAARVKRADGRHVAVDGHFPSDETTAGAGVCPPSGPSPRCSRTPTTAHRRGPPCGVAVHGLRPSSSGRLTATGRRFPPEGENAESALVNAPVVCSRPPDRQVIRFGKWRLANVGEQTVPSLERHGQRRRDILSGGGIVVCLGMPHVQGRIDTNGRGRVLHVRR
jgi:hypothetical protein